MFLLIKMNHLGWRNLEREIFPLRLPKILVVYSNLVIIFNVQNISVFSSNQSGSILLRIILF